MAKNNFRILFIPHGQNVDGEGRSEGSDWLVADLFEDEKGHYYITTDGVNGSEFDNVLVQHGATPEKLAHTLVKILNKG